MINVKPFEIRKKILLIDDDADVRSTTHMILNQELNIDVRVAASLDEGMEIIESWKPNMIVSDLDMPGKDGTHVYFLTRKNGSQIPIVYFSGSDFDLPRIILEDSQVSLVEKPKFEELTILTKLILDTDEPWWITA